MMLFHILMSVSDHELMLDNFLLRSSVRWTDESGSRDSYLDEKDMNCKNKAELFQKGAAVMKLKAMVAFPGGAVHKWAGHGI